MNINLKSKVIGKIASILGSFLIILRPKKAKELSEYRMALVHNYKNMSLQERLMRSALIKKLDKIDDYSEVAKLNKNFWSNKKATELFDKLEEGFQNDFLPHCSFIFKILKEKLSKESESFTRLVEIGTGNGDVLNYLYSEFPQIDRFIGIDLSVDQIEINKAKYKNNKKLEFVASDAIEWVREHGARNTIFVTSRGVLEYFEPQLLEEFLNMIYSLGNTIFIAIEPNGKDHNLETNFNSELYGYEPSFSHNYPYLFKKSGFSIWHFSQQPWHQETNMQTFVIAKS
ncbi:class I SAM-dependent methyltransferase [Winogradskyella psychrotolerans]|uniref:class I SAM-dependent methyltransferase n=1 Tax=Winogradskyella psychrotolerans TaxID=1344585 RepID=UPI001C07CDF8|nr:class I SAM-dependent methyltransferase [Winogradskyella psychrotolerans]MBU2928307.1 class I SAM-dependent methyltransferase [Winogradskyella psychrotolerans]